MGDSKPLDESSNLSTPAKFPLRRIGKSSYSEYEESTFEP